jgi:hypothetical protein
VISAQPCSVVYDISRHLRPAVVYIEASVINAGPSWIPRDDMWYVVCSLELLARLKLYFKRVLRRCVVVAFRVKASAGSSKGNGPSTTAVTVIVPRHRYVTVLFIDIVRAGVAQSV